MLTIEENRNKHDFIKQIYQHQIMIIIDLKEIYLLKRLIMSWELNNEILKIFD